MHTNQMIPVKMVIRSRFRSTTDDEPSEEEMPPPNRSDSPPPLPLCSSTSNTISRLVIIKITDNATVTAVSRLSMLGGAAEYLAGGSPGPCLPAVGGAASWGLQGACPPWVTIPADSHELTGIQARAAD